MSETDHYDILIAGGGMVGAALAVALSPLGLRVAVVEAVVPDFGMPDFDAPDEAQTSYDERTTAVNAASAAILRSLGVWDAVAGSAAAMDAIHISDAGRFGITRIRAVDYGLDALGHVIPNRVLGRAFYAVLDDADTVDVIAPARVTDVVPGDEAARITLDDGRALTATLLVGADGARSAVRDALGIAADIHAYQAKAVVSTVTASRPQPGWAYERFTADGPIALLPGPNGGCVLVWTRPTAQADGLLAASDNDFLDALNAEFGRRLGRLTDVGKRLSYPLYRVLAQRVTGPRAVLIGNAANNLHPVAGQGFNLGLRDAASLAERVAGAHASGVDIGAAALLGDYAAAREPDRQAISGMTHGLIDVFSNRVPGLRAGRNLGLLAVDVLPAAKRRMAMRTTGFGGHPPRLARGLPLTDAAGG